MHSAGVLIVWVYGVALPFISYILAIDNIVGPELYKSVQYMHDMGFLERLTRGCTLLQMPHAIGLSTKYACFLLVGLLGCQSPRHASPSPGKRWIFFR